MGIFGLLSSGTATTSGITFTSTAATTMTYDEVIAEIKTLTDTLDANSAAFAANVVANDAEIAKLQAASANDNTEKAKADDLSAKLKALLPPPVTPAPAAPAA